MIASEWHVGQLVWSLLWLSLFLIWLWLLISVFVDVFASHELSGPVKALWVLFVIVAPYLGVFVYVVARGGRMRPVGRRLGLASPTEPAAPARPVLSPRSGRCDRHAQCRTRRRSDHRGGIPHPEGGDPRRRTRSLTRSARADRRLSSCRTCRSVRVCAPG